MSDFEKLLDGLALWDEHKPQSGEDWVAVAERFIADGDTTENSSPLFAALVLAVRQRDKAQALSNAWEATHRKMLSVLGGELEDTEANWCYATGLAEALRDRAVDAEQERDRLRAQNVRNAFDWTARDEAREAEWNRLRAELEKERKRGTA